MSNKLNIQDPPIKTGFKQEKSVTVNENGFQVK